MTGRETGMTSVPAGSSLNLMGAVPGSELETGIGVAVGAAGRERAPMSLVEIKVEIAAVGAATADETLLEQGVENWSVLEDAIAKRAWVQGVCADAAEARTQWNSLVAILAAAGVTPQGEPATRVLNDADWRDSYKAHFHAWQFGRLHWVPVWEREQFVLPAGHAVLWLDPGLAFGTGNHETTRLCVERLVALAEARPDRAALRVVDAGCGSGILALSAARLGFEQIAGFDNDPEAVQVSEENASLNGLAGRIVFGLGDLVSGLAGRAGSVDVLLANIQADVLMRFARELVEAVAPGGQLVLSGILAGENAAVRTAFAAVAPQWSVDFRELGEWSDVVLVRPKRD